MLVIMVMMMMTILVMIMMMITTERSPLEDRGEREFPFPVIPKNGGL